MSYYDEYNDDAEYDEGDYDYGYDNFQKEDTYDQDEINAGERSNKREDPFMEKFKQVGSNLSPEYVLSNEVIDAYRKKNGENKKGNPLALSVAYHCLLYNSDGRIAVDSPYTHDPQKLERAANFWVKVKWRDADEAVKQIKKKRFKMNILRYIKEWLLFYNALDANNIEGLKKSKSKKSKSKKSKSKKSKSKKSKKKPGKKPRNKCKGKRKSECKQDENCRWDMQTRTCVSN